MCVFQVTWNFELETILFWKIFCFATCFSIEKIRDHYGLTWCFLGIPEKAQKPLG